MKDKGDEMVRRVRAYARRNKELREQVEQKLSAAMGQFVLARAEMSGEAIEEALAYPARPAAPLKNPVIANQPVGWCGNPYSPAPHPPTPPISSS